MAADSAGTGLGIACVDDAMIKLSRLDAEAGLAPFGVAGDALNAAIHLKREVPKAEAALVIALSPTT